MDSITSMYEPKTWKPDRPVSRGANEFHNAVADARYNHECVDRLIEIAKPHIRKNDIVVDFGAGTGTSAMRILENLNIKFRLWLVDNSPSWLGKSYELFSSRKNVSFFLLERKEDRTTTLSDTIGENSANHVISASTVHLIPNLKDTFSGIANALKPKGRFFFNSGNIEREGRKKDVLMADDTVKRVHDIALSIVLSDDRFAKYRKNLDKRIEEEAKQRKFVFPDPRPVEFYVEKLRDAGFKLVETNYKMVMVKYSDLMNFLRVKRLQAGILPEVGGKEAGPEEQKDRDELIRISALRLFKDLKDNNTMADGESFAAEWTYVHAIRPG